MLMNMSSNSSTATGANAESEEAPLSPPTNPITRVCPETDESEMPPSNRSAPVATMKLLTGPATEVRMSSITGWRKFRGSTGVGFAQPSKGMALMAATSGSTIVPIGSIWLNGFNDTRPSIRAVGSPQRDAVQAWADSCTLMANRNAIILNRMPTTSNGIVNPDSNKAGKLQREEVRLQK